MNNLDKFFYGAIVEALEEALKELVEEERYEHAALVRDEINNVKKEFNDTTIQTETISENDGGNDSGNS